MAATAGGGVITRSAGRTLSKRGTGGITGGSGRGAGWAPPGATGADCGCVKGCGSGGCNGGHSSSGAPRSSGEGCCAKAGPAAVITPARANAIQTCLIRAIAHASLL
jgi:hypothetical protein